MHVRRTITGLLAAGAVVLAPSSALADETGVTAAQVNKAVAAEGAAPAVSDPDASIQSTSAGFGAPSFGAPANSAAQEVLVELPTRGVPDRAGQTTVIDGTAPATKIAVQPTENGVRALIQIESGSAPERYRFKVRGGVVHLEQHGDGSISGYTADGRLATRVAPAWARDAKGREVPTFYEVHGTTIVQVVKHRGLGWTYGITADPSFDIFDAFVITGAVVGTGIACATAVTGVGAAGCTGALIATTGLIGKTLKDAAKP